MPQQLSTSRPRWAALLALVLLYAQSIALLHGYAHLPGRAAAEPVSALERWMGPHAEGSLACHVLDQLAHAQGTAPEPVLPVAMPVPAPDAARPASGCLPEAVAAYLARAPPRRA